MNISDFSKLSFFKIGKYNYTNQNTCDFSKCPRPHFCLSLIINGESVFYPENGKEVNVKKGNIIFIPITSRYVSVWKGNPDIMYISMHFAFEPNCGISEKQRFVIQRVSLPDFDKLKEQFNYAFENYNGNETERFTVLSIFYSVLKDVLPNLEHENTTKMDKRIEEAIEYINLNSEKDISVSHLAKISNMSVSNFYSVFKKSIGKTPIEYKNHICISRAMRLLQTDEQSSIESISDELGFYSSTYFRRVFKNITGKTPREYRKATLGI